MNRYKRIIAAVDLNAATDAITVERAKKLADDNNAELYLVHAIESLNAYGAPYAYPTISEVEEEISTEHKEQLTKEAEKLGVPVDTLRIEMGAPNVVIVHQAEVLKADLIIVGSHSRHGLGLLLGSTADAVLHNAPCDVMAIHLKD